MIPKKIIDNSDLKLADFLNAVLKEIPDTCFDIATAFFNLKAYAFIRDNLKGVKHFRLLLGKAPEIRNDNTLGDIISKMLKEEVESFDLSKDSQNLVKEFIEFLKRDNVEVRIYDKEFLHGKAYIFDQLVVVGSSNFTPSGLTHNTELNSVSLESEAQYVRTNWFDKFWNEARDFKLELINLLESSRFGSREYTPYEVFIKSLFELQKDDLSIFEEDSFDIKPASKVNLAEFQEDAVRRIFTRLKKYKACMVADSVGLGKTYIAKRVIEEFGFYKRKRFLVICPAQLKDMWKSEIKDLILSESIISQEELAGNDFIEKTKSAVGSDINEISLIVVDESHNFRNPLSNRWENFFTLVCDHIAKNNNRPYILFLTATPINNSIWDLYWQIMLLILSDQKAFLKEGISDIFKFFKEIDRSGDLSLLNDLMNEISIRRTRDYIQKNYPDAEINGKKLIFPKRILKNIDYQLDKTYEGLYKKISHTVTEKLTMAYYRIMKYKKTEKLSQTEELALGRMIALEGIFRTILLKRLESSVYAFCKSINNHILFLEKLLNYLEKGKLLSKHSFYKYIFNSDEESEESFIDELEDINLEDYDKKQLFEDIKKDIEILSEINKKTSQISAKEDAKLKELKRYLLSLGKEGQVVVFTYYADTLDYIFNEIINDSEFEKIRIEKISGRIVSEKKRSEIIEKFMGGGIDILMSTDVLSEGMNLQRARFLINYDLHWNPTRMIQRAGRIDRIGSPYNEIFIYNFFPEEELEDLLRLVEILQNKIKDIDNSVGLDATVLGEQVNPKVFGVIRRIKEKDENIFDELERDVFGGGERFYQPLMDYLKSKSIDEISMLPFGIYSGLKKGIKAIFFYYKYGEDFHFWYLYDLKKKEIIKNKTKILEYIACPQNEPRVVPDFFETIYDVNKVIIEDIERTYKEIEQKHLVDPSLAEITGDRSKKFISYVLRELDLKVDDYYLDFPEDKGLEEKWESVREKLLTVSFTKKRLKILRGIWNSYRETHKNWKKLLKELEEFLENKGTFEKGEFMPFDKTQLKLVAVDFVS